MGRRRGGLGDLCSRRGLVRRDAPPFSFWLRQKENAPRPVEEKKRFGGSVCASADLLPPAGDGWHSLAEVRDGNAPPLGNP